MRLGFLYASAALAAGVALSACSGGANSSSTVPSSDAQSLITGRSNGHEYKVRLAPGVKPMTIGCDYSVYAFCFYVKPGDSGPYVETSTAPSYQLYNNGWITKNKKTKPDKKFDDYFYPDPGNPTYQYILYSGKNPKKTTKFKYTDYYCISTTPSGCPSGTYTFKLGIAIEPATGS